MTINQQHEERKQPSIRFSFFSKSDNTLDENKLDRGSFVITMCVIERR